jgi:transcriptional regulator of acetoin/glycerol metabolism
MASSRSASPQEPGAGFVPQWQAFVSGNADAPEIVRPVTLQAWARCSDLGIDPEHLRYNILTEEELTEKRAANAQFLEAARPYLQHLSLALSDRAHCVALADADGWILELLEQPKDAFGGAATGICVGSSWNERHIGNNGIGSALATGEPVFVYGIEHFAISFHSAHCLGVPIRVNDRLVGCLDVSVTRAEDADPRHMVLAQASVASIESTLSKFAELQTRATTLEKFAAMGGLLATTLHDLRNPLNVMKGISRIGASTAKEPGERAFFEKLSKQAAMMEEMVERLQDFGHHREPVSESPIAVLSEVLGEVADLCRSQGIVLDVSTDADAECLLHAALLKRAIHNVVSNAIKAMPEGGTLFVRSRMNLSHLAIEIQDTGKGIPRELRGSVFEPFVSGRSDGTGLGLYMVHEAITKDHNGRLWFDTEDGRGTTFVVELPTIHQP